MPIAINGSGTITGVSAGGLQAGAGPVLMTAQASTSGTSIDFTGIPSWVKRITVILSGVSTNGSSGVVFQLGSGTIKTSAYNNRNSIGTTAFNATSTSTGGFGVNFGTASSFVDGSIVLHSPTTNAWIAAGLFTSDYPAISWTGGNVALSGSLDRVRITTGNGTDTFDAGSINVMYE